MVWIVILLVVGVFAYGSCSSRKAEYVEDRSQLPQRGGVPLVATTAELVEGVGAESLALNCEEDDLVEGRIDLWSNHRGEVPEYAEILLDGEGRSPFHPDVNRFLANLFRDDADRVRNSIDASIEMGPRDDEKVHCWVCRPFMFAVAKEADGWRVRIHRLKDEPVVEN